MGGRQVTLAATRALRGWLVFALLFFSYFQVDGVLSQGITRDIATGTSNTGPKTRNAAPV